jgi:hypothetical protein
MRISITVLVSLLSFNLLAEFPLIETVGLNLTLRQFKGTMSAQSLIYPDEALNYRSPVEFFIHKEETSFRFFNDVDEYLIENVNFKADSASIGNLNVKVIPSKIVADFTQALMSYQGKNNRIQNLSIQCRHQRNLQSVEEEFIDSCSTHALLSASKVDLGEMQISLLGKEKAGVRLEKLSLSVFNHRFNLTVKANLDIKAKVKASGESHYNQETKVLRIRLDKVKASFLNITKRIFEQLEQNQSPKMRVVRPYIYFHLK